MILPQHEGCPFGGFHKIAPWGPFKTSPRQGVVCVRCHKTWTATVDGFVPTYSDSRNNSND